MNKSLFLTAHIVSLSLALAACGGGGDTSGSDNDASSNELVDQQDNQNNTDGTGNRAPVARDISLQSDLTVPFVEQQLMATDEDGDTLIYTLESPRSGPGYSDAFIEENTGKLYVTLQNSDVDHIELKYKASDGIAFSESASIRIEFGPVNAGGQGLREIDAADYGRYQLAYFDGNRFGANLGDVPTLPSQVDLSPSFPVPGNQGDQGSCVGWASAYALKTYQEKIEMQWPLNSDATVFSPAFVYNQINGGQDGGSFLVDALQLIVDKGAATLQTMPYDPHDYRSQPNSVALSEAAQYKALSFNRISGLQQVKAALANRQPVLTGIIVYSSLLHLSGPNSVYNTYSGGSQGGHAVTLVGYDDNRFGGAFKVINSWGTSWGDNGFFWLPYDGFSQVVSETWTLTDKANTGNIDPDIPVEPEQEDGLPNLQIVDWSLSYNPVPGGDGEWTWSVTNNGTAPAPAGADVNLMLSRDNQIDSSDIYIVYEEIPVDLAAGETIYRDSDSPRQFRFPNNLPAGTYYVAMWVDDLDEVRESQEQDNISFGQNEISIGASSLPDLSIEYWWAGWDDSGFGTLEYTVTNQGSGTAQTTGWDVNLVLSSANQNNSDIYYLFYEGVEFQLASGESVYRDQYNPAYFNVFETSAGSSIPAGTYYMSLWVDDLERVEESNEINNLSVASNTVTIVNGFSRSQPAQEGSAFNGKQMPTNMAMKKIEISYDATGKRTIKDLGPVEPKIRTASDQKPVFLKRTRSSNPLAQPKTHLTRMPKEAKINAK